jgi:hypothetical protein
VVREAPNERLSEPSDFLHKKQSLENALADMMAMSKPAAPNPAAKTTSGSEARVKASGRVDTGTKVRGEATPAAAEASGGGGKRAFLTAAIVIVGGLALLLAFQWALTR